VLLALEEVVEVVVVVVGWRPTLWRRCWRLGWTLPSWLLLAW
jgi:hypothetical protein